MSTNKIVAAELRRIADLLEKRDEPAPKPVIVELTNRADVMKMRFPEFASKYLKLNHPVKGIIPLPTYDYLRRYVHALEKHRFVIGRKFRQGYFTTVTIAWMLRQAMFTPDKRYMMMTRTDREAGTANHLARFMIEQMPEFIRPELKTCSRHELSFADTNSTIRFYTPEAAKGHSVDHLFCDEMAFWKDAEGHWKSMYPILSTGGHCVILSTPNGKGPKDYPNFFYKTWEGSLDGTNEFEPFTAAYVENPEYQDEAWVKMMKENLGEKGWRQEVLQEFLE